MSVAVEELLHVHGQAGVVGLLAGGDDAEGLEVVDGGGFRLQAALGKLVEYLRDHYPGVVHQLFLLGEGYLLHNVVFGAADDS